MHTHAKEPYTHSKEPHTHSKEPHTHSKEPYIHSVESPEDDARNVCSEHLTTQSYFWMEKISPVGPRRGKFSTNLSPSGRIRQVQNTTYCHNSGTMNLNSIRIGTVRGHAPYKYPPRNTMPESPGTNSNSLRISWSDTSFSPAVTSKESLEIMFHRDQHHVARVCRADLTTCRACLSHTLDNTSSAEGGAHHFLGLHLLTIVKKRAL